MPTILKLDGQHYLIPDSVNLNTIVKAFEKVRRLQWDYSAARTEERYVLEERLPSVAIEIVRKEQIVNPRVPAARRIEEKASEPCNGDMGIDRR